MTTLVETPLECARGDDNLYTIDLSTALDASDDQVWFMVKRKKSDIDDDAVFAKGLNVVGLSGIVSISEAEGTCQVQVDPADTATLADKALFYDVQFKAAADAKVRTVAQGVLLLSGEVTQATS